MARGGASAREHDAPQGSEWGTPENSDGLGPSRPTNGRSTRSMRTHFDTTWGSAGPPMVHPSALKSTGRCATSHGQPTAPCPSVPPADIPHANHPFRRGARRRAGWGLVGPSAAESLDAVGGTPNTCAVFNFERGLPGGMNPDGFPTRLRGLLALQPPLSSHTFDCTLCASAAGARLGVKPTTTRPQSRIVEVAGDSEEICTRRLSRGSHRADASFRRGRPPTY